MKTLLYGFAGLPALALIAGGCAVPDKIVANETAAAICAGGPAAEIAGFPDSIMLPAGAALDDKSSGSPPEFASRNYQIVAHSMSDIEEIKSFYRCILPRRGFSIIDEEQGNYWLLRFSGPEVDDGSVLIGAGAAEGETSIQIFLIEQEK